MRMSELSKDPMKVVEAAVRLANVFVLSQGDVEGALKGFALDQRDIFKGNEIIPDLSPEEIQAAISVITADYWQLACWSCRG